MLDYNQRTNLFNRLSATEDELITILLDNYIISEKSGFVWKEKQKQWKKIDINHLKHMVRNILWCYCKRYRDSSPPNYERAYDLIVDDSIEWNDGKKCFFQGNNVVYDITTSEYRNVRKIDHLYYE